MSILLAIRWTRIFPQLRANVKRARANQPIVIVLFDDVRAPTCYSRRGKQRCVEFRFETEHPENRRGVKIDICAKSFLAVHHFFELLANWHPVFLASPFAKITPDLAH